MGVWPQSKLLAAELRVNGHAALALHAPSASSSSAAASSSSSSAAASSRTGGGASGSGRGGARSTRLASEVAGLC